MREKTVKKTILVLEDAPVVISVLRQTLRQCRLIEATNAEQAFRLFIKHGRQFDLLVADVTLPTGSGVQVAVILRLEIPDLPVILTSEYPVSDWSDLDSADLEILSSKSVAFLQKPFQSTALSTVVGELLKAPAPEKAGWMWQQAG